MHVVGKQMPLLHLTLPMRRQPPKYFAQLLPQADTPDVSTKTYDSKGHSRANTGKVASVCPLSFLFGAWLS